MAETRARQFFAAFKKFAALETQAMSFAKQANMCGISPQRFRQFLVEKHPDVWGHVVRTRGKTASPDRSFLPAGMASTGLKTLGIGLGGLGGLYLGSRLTSPDDHDYRQQSQRIINEARSQAQTPDEADIREIEVQKEHEDVFKKVQKAQSRRAALALLGLSAGYGVGTAASLAVRKK